MRSEALADAKGFARKIAIRPPTHQVAADHYVCAEYREVDRSIAAIAGSAGNRVPANPCIDAQGIWGPISNNGK